MPVILRCCHQEHRVCGDVCDVDVLRRRMVRESGVVAESRDREDREMVGETRTALCVQHAGFRDVYRDDRTFRRN